MTPWIQVYANLPSHRKVCRLRQELGFKTNYEAVGLLVSLWCWAAVNAPDGNLTGYASCDISEAIGYKKATGKLLGVLETTGFLDQRENGGYQIHDWEEHAALLMDSHEQQKKNTRERVRRYRDKRKQECNTGDAVTCSVTGNACNAPTLPNLTLPNLTNNNSGGGDGAGACASEADLKSIGLYPWGYPGMLTEGIASTVRQFAETLMENSARRSATAQDGRIVFERVCRLENGRWRIDPDAADLLEYAVGQAAIAGKGGNWNYITGILERLALRDIRTKAQAMEYDMTRGDEER